MDEKKTASFVWKHYPHVETYCIVLHSCGCFIICFYQIFSIHLVSNRNVTLPIIFVLFLTENDISNCFIPSSFYLTSWFSIFCSGTVVEVNFFYDFHFQLHVAISIIPIPLYWMQIFVSFECLNVFFFHRRDLKNLSYIGNFILLNGFEILQS